jgi:hypothetical protein
MKAANSLKISGSLSISMSVQEKIFSKEISFAFVV